jgi:hypothetical protein
MIRLDLPRSRDPFDAMRAAVEAGEPNQPVEIWHEGQKCLEAHSLFRGACLTVQETPYVAIIPYQPHHRATIGPRLAQVLADDRSRRAAMREAAETARKDRAARVGADGTQNPPASEAV